MSWKDAQYGLKSYFSSLIKGKIIAPNAIPEDLVGRMYVADIENKIEKSDTSCQAVLDLMEKDYPEPIKRFFDETGNRYSMTGGNQAQCKEFLIEYLKWLDKQITRPTLPEIPDAPKMPSLPSLPSFPSMPFKNTANSVKRSFQTVGLVIMLFFLLVIYLIFVKGRGASGVTVVGTK